MKETDIRKYAELMKELGLTGLEITEDNQVVRLERTAAPEVRQTVPVAVPAAPAPEVGAPKTAGNCGYRQGNGFFAAVRSCFHFYVKAADRFSRFQRQGFHRKCSVCRFQQI